MSPEKLHVVPEAVDTHFFDPNQVQTDFDLNSRMQLDLASRAPLSLSENTTVYLSIFKWENRKGWQVLLTAYFESFHAEDDVLLVLLTSGYHVGSETAKDFTQLIENFAFAATGKSLHELPRVHVLRPQVPQTDMPALFQAATAFVLPSRGEGWGRPHVEAMAMELPVIATFWSGSTEYMTENNSYPLQINGLQEVTTPSMLNICQALLMAYCCTADYGRCFPRAQVGRSIHRSSERAACPRPRSP